MKHSRHHEGPEPRLRTHAADREVKAKQVSNGARQREQAVENNKASRERHELNNNKTCDSSQWAVAADLKLTACSMAGSENISKWQA